MQLPQKQKIPSPKPTKKRKSKRRNRRGSLPKPQPILLQPNLCLLARFYLPGLMLKSAKDQGRKGYTFRKSTDAEFQRRAYLDIIGRIPTSVETRAFLENTIPNKRVKLVDDLLADDEFGKHMADIWQALLLPGFRIIAGFKPNP